MNRQTGLAICNVEMANPNGDPNNEGAPRQIDGGRGFFTEVSVKRKIRDLCQPGTPLFEEMVRRFNIDPGSMGIYESENRGFPGRSGKEAADLLKQALSADVEDVIRTRFDARIFSLMTLFPAKKGKGEGGATKNSFSRLGCVSIRDGISINPVEVCNYTLGKRFCLQDELVGDNTLAPDARKCVKHGVYVMRISVDGNLAARCHATQKDIEAFKFLLSHIWSHSMSCTRPAGSIQWTNIWWLEHPSPWGGFREFDFWNALTPTHKTSPDTPSNQLSDYNMPGLSALPEKMAQRTKDILAD